MSPKTIWLFAVLVVCVYPAAASTYYVGGSTTMDIYAQNHLHVAAARAAAAHGVCRRRRPARGAANGDEPRFFEFRRCSGSTVQLGPIRRFFSMFRAARKVCKSLKDLVELVGIEPTTSSLRTMRSPS
jgi:hypothetical protein